VTLLFGFVQATVSFSLSFPWKDQNRHQSGP